MSCNRPKVEDIRNKYKKIFDALDTDHDGFLTLANLPEINKHLSEPQPCQEQDDWEVLLKMIDQGNKGCGFEEFLYLLFCDGKNCER